MPNSSRAIAIAHLLALRTHAELAALYHAGMEVQCCVAKDEGELKDGHSRKKGGGHVYTDGVETWHDFRIPKNAWNDPEDNSGDESTFSLMDRADAIGMTGWNFVDRRSIYFAFDFDAIVGHSEKHVKKLEDAELARVQEAAINIPWVTVRKSTSGNGLHLYVFLETPHPMKNHDEHAALARAVLGQMSAQVGYDFINKVDTCGGNIWVWARRMKGTDGLSLIKAATRKLDRIPEGWRQHFAVKRGVRKKTLPEFAEDDAKGFDELAGQHQRTPLDEEHRKLIEDLHDHGCNGWWDSDHHMLVTHTKHLENAHARLDLKGKFKTSSQGTDLDTQNVFAFPHNEGAWVLRRYSKGAAEDKSWEQGGPDTWTRCWFNREPDLRSAARAAGATETDKGQFIFREASVAGSVLADLGGRVDVPVFIQDRAAKLYPHKDGKRTIIEVDHSSKDSADKMNGWWLERGKWRTVVTADPKLESEVEVGALDDLLRHAVTETRQDAGWYIQVEGGWNNEPSTNVSNVLANKGYKQHEAKALMGASILKPWTVCSRPFKEEYPGDRLWNKSRAQYRYPRLEEPGPFPHWDMIYSHCGAGLDDALRKSGWALANDVKDGKTYLQLVVAAMLQDPYQPTPYIFLWSEEQNNGKSIFHESFEFLFSNGMVQANLIFEKDERFNAQLEGAVACVIEEMNLKKNKKAYEKIKNWVTAPSITIRKMHMDAYSIPNHLHFFHTANDYEAFPVFTGDTRLTMIHVPPLDSTKIIPKEDLKVALKKEAQNFLSYLLNMDIPPSGSRLRVPEINTGEKDMLAKQGRSPVEEFIDSTCFRVTGEQIGFDEFYDRFREQLDASDMGEWSSKNKVSRSIPPYLPKGKVGAKSFIGNLSFADVVSTKPKLIVMPDGKLVQVST